MMRERGNRLRSRRIVGHGYMRAAARDTPDQLRHLPGMVLIHRHDEPAGIRLFLLAESA
jgi:hypothetical protein